MDKCQQYGTKVSRVFRFMPTLKEEEVILFKENVAVGGNSKLLCGFSSLSDFFIFWTKQASCVA